MKRMCLHKKRVPLLQHFIVLERPRRLPFHPVKTPYRSSCPSTQHSDPSHGSNCDSLISSPACLQSLACKWVQNFTPILIVR